LGLLFIAVGVGIVVMVLLIAVELKVDGFAQLPSAISGGGSDDLSFYLLCLKQTFLLTALKTQCRGHSCWYYVVVETSNLLVMHPS